MEAVCLLNSITTITSSKRCSSPVAYHTNLIRGTKVIHKLRDSISTTSREASTNQCLTTTFTRRCLNITSIHTCLSIAKDHRRLNFTKRPPKISGGKCTNSNSDLTKTLSTVKLIVSRAAYSLEIFRMMPRTRSLLTHLSWRVPSQSLDSRSIRKHRTQKDSASASTSTLI